VPPAEGTAWYVYGVVGTGERRDAAPLAPRTGGVGSGAVRVVGKGRLAAVVSEVSLDEFSEEALPERLNDRVWLEEKARAHESVLQELVGQAPVVPMRFGAIYRLLEDVEALLDSRRAELESALGRVRGRVEMGVKAWADRSGAESADAGESGAAEGEAGAGRAYLQRRRDARERSALLDDRLLEIARRAHERLLATAVDGVVNRPQAAALSGRPETMILNAAYLVAAGDRALLLEVDALNREFGADAVSFEATGPWPPHNFVDEAAS
jgi:hypothetical protein